VVYVSPRRRRGRRSGSGRRRRRSCAFSSIIIFPTATGRTSLPSRFFVFLLGRSRSSMTSDFRPGARKPRFTQASDPVFILFYFFFPFLLSLLNESSNYLCRVNSLYGVWGGRVINCPFFTPFFLACLATTWWDCLDLSGQCVRFWGGISLFLFFLLFPLTCSVPLGVHYHRFRE
jgi:hypothetical protein